MRGYTADLTMLVVTFFWGASYLFMEMGLNSIDEFNLIALRFGLAFIFVLPIVIRRFHSIDRATLKYSLYLGVIFF